MKVTWKHIVGGAAAAALSFTALIGFAHTRPGQALRPLLFAINRVAPAANRGAVAAVAAVAPTVRGATDGSCPLGYDRGMSAADVEARRQRGLASQRGASPAHDRPALGFTLGTSRRADVQAWAARQGVACSTPRGPTQIVCTRVASEQLPEPFGGLAIDEVFFQFGPADQLVSVGTVRSTHDAELAVRVEGALDQAVAARAGAAGTVAGERSGAYLASGPLRQTRTEFHFSDYFASVSATNVGQGRVVVSERYELLADKS